MGQSGNQCSLNLCLIVYVSVGVPRLERKIQGGNYGNWQWMWFVNARGSLLSVDCTQLGEAWLKVWTQASLAVMPQCWLQEKKKSPFKRSVFVICLSFLICNNNNNKNMFVVHLNRLVKVFNKAEEDTGIIVGMVSLCWVCCTNNKAKWKLLWKENQQSAQNSNINWFKH